MPESFTPLLVVRDRLAQRGPERAPVIVMNQVNEFVNDHVLDQPHRRLDDAPIEPDDSCATATPAALLLLHENSRSVYADLRGPARHLLLEPLNGVSAVPLEQEVPDLDTAPIWR